MEQIEFVFKVVKNIVWNFLFIGLAAVIIAVLILIFPGLLDILVATLLILTGLSCILAAVKINRCAKIKIKL